jgi:hypothetical protein
MPGSPRSSPVTTTGEPKLAAWPAGTATRIVIALVRTAIAIAPLLEGDP